MRVVELVASNGASGGARVAISDRSGGSSTSPYDSLNLSHTVGDLPRRVTENRRRAAFLAGLDPARVVWMDQVHGTAVAVVDEVPVEPLPATDAVVTASRGLALAVLVADCLPVLIGDGSAGVVGAAHAGRRGLAEGIVGATVAAMASLGANPAAMSALVGPGVGPCCYEVPQSLRSEVVARVPETCAQTRTGRPALDLPAGVLAELTRAGVRQTSRMATCTVEDPAYYSYRRDRVTGRFAGFIWRA